MKQTIKKLWMMALPMLLGLASCTSDMADNSVNNQASEQDLVGLWWDEFEYADVTEAGVPFSRVLLAVKAEAKFITSLFDGDYLPSIALRFHGESNFQVVHDRLNPTDRQNYEALVKGFDEPFAAVNALLKAFQDKGVELNGTE